MHLNSNKILEQVQLLRDKRFAADALTLLLESSWPCSEPKAWLLRGTLEHQLGKYTDAILSLSVASGFQELYFSAAYHLGEVHRSLGQFDQAASWFIAALHADPTHRYSHNSLQFTRFSMDLLPRVIESYRYFVNAAPSLVLGYQLLAHYLLKSGAIDEAISINRYASRLDCEKAAVSLAPTNNSLSLPKFMIIGVPKGGTSSLLGWLATHPKLWCHPRKELHFFDGDYSHGAAWYSSHFPLFDPQFHIRCGEATPNYFQQPACPQRIRELLPFVRLVILLRDPLQRALSWLYHLQRFEGLVGNPSQLLENELDELESLEPSFITSSGFRWPNAIHGSCYNVPLQRWLDLFPREQLLILRSELLFDSPGSTLKHVADFIGVDAEWNWGELNPFNVNPLPYSKLPDHLIERLQSFFEKHSEWAMTHAISNL